MKPLRKAEFKINSIPNETFDGYTDDHTWNGWACPYFEWEEAERVLRASEANGCTWLYDAEQDVFHMRHAEDPDDYEPELFEATVRETIDGENVTVYGIGTYAWVWELAPQT